MSCGLTLVTRWRIRWPWKLKRMVTWTSKILNICWIYHSTHRTWKLHRIACSITTESARNASEVLKSQPCHLCLALSASGLRCLNNSWTYVISTAHVYCIWLCHMMVNWLGDSRWLFCYLGVSLLKGNSLNVVASLTPSCLQFCCLDMSWHTVHHLVFNSLGISIDPDLVLNISCWSQELDISFWMLGHALCHCTILKALIWSDLMLADVCSSLFICFECLGTSFLDCKGLHISHCS